jgi:hypothetical protein
MKATDLLACLPMNTLSEVSPYGVCTFISDTSLKISALYIPVPPIMPISAEIELTD